MFEYGISYRYVISQAKLTSENIFSFLNYLLILLRKHNENILALYWSMLLLYN